LEALQFWIVSFWFKPHWYNNVAHTEVAVESNSSPFTDLEVRVYFYLKFVLCSPTFFIFLFTFSFLPSLDIKGRNMRSQFLRSVPVPGLQLGTYAECS